MTDIVRKWLLEKYNSAYERVHTVADIISDYFGEELVDAKIEDADILLNDLFSQRTLRSMVNINSVTTDSVLLFGMTEAVPREKWEEDAAKFFVQLADDYYFEALSHKVNIALIGNLENDPVEILIRFPKVTVTNEYDKSITITELYTRILVGPEGKMFDRFRMMRAEYTAAQYICGYAHSHLPGAYLEWMQPCLGSGPIYNTQNYLLGNYDADRWGLFCYELSKYVTVESISGVPYVRLEGVGNMGGRIEAYPIEGSSISFYRSQMLDNFVKYFIRTQPFNASFSDGRYRLGEDAIDFLLRISKCFILWYNRKFRMGIYRAPLEELLGNGILRKYVIVGKQLYKTDVSGRIADMSHLQGQELFTFKDHIVTLNFIDAENIEDNNAVILLNSGFVSALLTKMLGVINYVYRNQEGGNSTEDKEGTQTAPAKKFCFL